MNQTPPPVDDGEASFTVVDISDIYIEPDEQYEVLSEVPIGRSTSIPKDYWDLSQGSYNGAFSGVNTTIFTNYLFSPDTSGALNCRVSVHCDYTGAESHARIRVYDASAKKWLSGLDYTTASFKDDGVTVTIRATGLSDKHLYCFAVSKAGLYPISGTITIYR